MPPWFYLPPILKPNSPTPKNQLLPGLTATFGEKEKKNKE